MWIPQVWVFLPQFLAEELASLAPQHAFRFTVDEPRDRRMLITWLSYRDLTELVRCCLFASRLGYTIVYGMSANRDQWWDNSKAAHLGFVAQDSSEPFRAKVEAQAPLNPADSAAQYQGGAFVEAGPWLTRSASKSVAGGPAALYWVDIPACRLYQ